MVIVEQTYMNDNENLLQIFDSYMIRLKNFSSLLTRLSWNRPLK